MWDNCYFWNSKNRWCPPPSCFIYRPLNSPLPGLNLTYMLRNSYLLQDSKIFDFRPPGTSVCSHCNSFSLWKSWSTVPFAMASSGRLGVEQLQTQQLCVVFLEDVEYVQALHTESFFFFWHYQIHPNTSHWLP